MLAANGLALKMHAMLDSGAAGTAFLHYKHHALVEERLKPKFMKTKDKGVPIAGHDNKTTGFINRAFQATLVIDGRRISTWFMLCDTGRHDVLLGRIWFEETGTLIDCKNRRLVWPGNSPYNANRDLVIPKSEFKSPPSKKEHQEDVLRRDNKIDQQIRKHKITIMQRPQTTKVQPTSWRKDNEREIKFMEQELKKLCEPESGSMTIPERPKKTRKNGPRNIRFADIALLEAGNFLRNAKRKDVVIGATSIHEIESLIEDRRDPILPNDEEALRQLVEEKLPATYKEFADVFSKAASDELPPRRHGVDHDIVLEAENNLAPSPLYSMSLEQLELVKDYLQDHLQRGFIVPSDAPYASPVLFAKKPGGGWRFCVDYRKLNEITKKDRYPLPLIEETLTRLARAKVFTKLDVRQAFYRIRMKESVEDLTTFRTRYGSYKYRVLPFGLCNGPASFQRFINDVLMEYLDDFCTAYVDDILIYSGDLLEHEVHVKMVLQRLRDAGLQVDIKKSEFGVQSTKFLGFIISTTGVGMDPEKVEVVKNWQTPTSVKGIQSFIGFCNFYRPLLKNFGRVARPLTSLLKKGAWHPLDGKEIESFEEMKKLILSEAVIAHYSPYNETRSETDASDGVVAGALSQLQADGTWKPVAYYSKAMSPEEMRYEIHDKEMLAIVRGFQTWRNLLIGLQKTPFLAITDHRALEYFSTKRLLNPRQARWSDLLADYHFRITYRPGTANAVADALTRKTEEWRTQKEKDIAARTQLFLDPSMFVEPSHTFKEHSATVAILDEGKAPYELVDQILSANRTHDSVQPFRALAQAGNEKGWRLEQGLVTRFEKLFVPDVDRLRTRLIEEAHSRQTTAHPGKEKTTKLIAKQYYWPKLPIDCNTFVANCRTCRRNHIPRDKAPGLLHPLPIGDRCWQHVSFDFKSFPKDKKGYDNAFVVIDRFGKRAFSLPCHKEVTATQAAELYYHHIWRIYGTPETATSDRGPQFVSAFMDELCKLTGVKQKLSTAYHPQTDGNTEVLNQYIDQRLRPFVNYFQDNWSDLLPAMDFAQATLTHTSTGFSPFELEFGYRPRMQFDWKERTQRSATVREQITREEAQAFASRTYEAVKWAKINLQRAQDRQSRQANKHRREPDFEVGDTVYVTRKGWVTERPSIKLESQNAGPYKIIAMKGHSYIIDLPKHMKMSNVFHADRLRKAANDPLPGQIEDPEPPIEINGEPEYAVNEILASRVRNNVLQYRVSWVGHDPDDEWYDANGFIGAPHKVKAFHEAYPEQAGPPARLAKWIEAFEKQEALEPSGEDNLAVKSAKKGRKRRQR